MAGIDDWDEPALTALHEAGKGSAAELVEAIGNDQFDEGMARAWINDALGRGLIARVEDSYAITEKGSARIGAPRRTPRSPAGTRTTREGYAASRRSASSERRLRDARPRCSSSSTVFGEMPSCLPVSVRLRGGSSFVP